MVQQMLVCTHDQKQEKVCFGADIKYNISASQLFLDIPSPANIEDTDKDSIDNFFFSF